MTILEQMLEGMGSVTTLGHIRPDGDCLGSALGLYDYLRLNCPNIQTVVYLGEASDKFSYLKGSDEIHHRADGENYKLCVCLNCGGMGRLGEFSSLLAQAKKSLCLGHYVTNARFAGSNLVVPEASSTYGVLYEQLGEEKTDIRVAECLYMGIVHDTDIFGYSCTSGTTTEITGRLMAKGIDFGSIIDNSFYKKTYIQNQILGRALLESITFSGGECVFSATRQNGMGFYGVNSKGTDGITGQLRLTGDVRMAIFLYQAGAQEYKVSMRSQSLVNVSRIATFFGGGGHIRAAGCTMTGSIHDVVNDLSGHITEQLEPKTTDRV